MSHAVGDIASRPAFFHKWIVYPSSGNSTTHTHTHARTHTHTHTRTHTHARTHAHMIRV